MNYKLEFCSDPEKKQNRFCQSLWESLEIPKLESSVLHSGTGKIKSNQVRVTDFGDGI